jgi:energy-coupling factor transporter ATP-binding protein EcfA2
MPAESATTTLPSTVDGENIVFSKAVAFVNHTNENLFLTGRAGTGKTTFLKYIMQHTHKKCAVIAPTGVAAINAGGETIHSFLQVPLAPFIPANKAGFSAVADVSEDKNSLLAQLRFKDLKIKLLQQLELLIIDEVSMVRCDVADAIDLILRHVRKRWNSPFGGVQVLFIGDLFQLPPVARQEDWDILGKYYESPFFFDAHVLRENPPLYLELKKIYRQKEQAFIEILNNVRVGKITDAQLDTLNGLYNSSPKKEEGYITLATHNKTVADINRHEVDGLKTKSYVFEAKVEGDFNPKSFPTEQLLQLKEGAQVMFIKNDMKTPRRYYNGKIGTVSKITADEIFVTFKETKDAEPIKLELETWNNIRYTINPTTNQLAEETLGSFKQYPVRLAWAVTVHKSQGLTLDKVIVDLDGAFASGQVYVALSRCTTLDGLVLKSKLSRENIFTDSRVVQFATTEATEAELDDMLVQKMKIAAVARVTSVFSFTEVIQSIQKTDLLLSKSKTTATPENRNLAAALCKILEPAREHALAFQRQMAQRAVSSTDDHLKERTAAALNYFSENVFIPCLKLIHDYLVFAATLAKPGKQVKLWEKEKVKLEELREQMRKCWE